MFSKAPAVKLQVVGLVAVSFLLGIVSHLHLEDTKELTSSVGIWVAVWVVALGLFLFGLWRAVRITDTKADPATEGALPGRLLPPRVEAGLFLLVMAAGLFFRLYKIDSIPPGLNHDAAWNGLYAIKITQGMSYAPYVAEAWGRETLFHHVIAFFQIVVGPTKLAIQLASVTIGVATLAAFYLLIRRLFDTRLALVATYLLGVSGWHLTLSKVGWRAIAVPLFECLVFYFLVKAVQERRVRDFVLAGIFLGLSLDTYDAARILPFIAGAYLLYEVVRNPALLRYNYVSIGSFGLFAILAFSPLGWYAMHNWDGFTGRASFTWIGAQIEQAGSIQPLFNNLGSALGMFNFRANGDDFFVNEPLLDIPVSIFSALGLIYSIFHWRQQSYFLLLAMFFLTIVVGIASEPNGNRMLGAVIPVTAFAAVFLVVSWRWLGQAYPRYSSLFTVALVGVLIYAGAYTYHSYVGPDARVQWGFYPETTRVGLYMQDIAGDHEIFAAAGNWPRDSLTYLSYQGEGDPFRREYTYFVDATQLLAVQPALDEGTALIIEATAGNAVILETLSSKFPEAVVDRIHYPDGSSNVIAWVLRLPPGGDSLNRSRRSKPSAGGFDPGVGEW